MVTFVKFLMSVVGLLIAGLPTWFFLGLRSMAAPEGFWQELVFTGLGLWFLGGLQFVFFVIYIALMVSVWLTD